MINVDNFIERIVPYNDDKFTKSDFTNKKFLDDIQMFSKEYCKVLKVSESDFCNGKELFEIFFYFTDEEHQDALFSNLNDEVRKEIESVYRKNIEIVRKQRNLFPKFDYKIVCEAIINIIMATDSYEIINIDEVVSCLNQKNNKNQNNLSEILNVRKKSDVDQFEVKKVIDEFCITDNIQEIKKCVDKSLYEAKMRNRIPFLVKLLAVPLYLASGILSIFHLRLGLTAIASTTLLTVAMSGKIRTQMKAGKLLYRYIYWIYVLSACYSYYYNNFRSEK